MAPDRPAKKTKTKTASRVASSAAPTGAASTDAPTSQPTPNAPVTGTKDNSTGATSKRRGRGPSRGKNAECLRATHGRLGVFVPDGVGVPVGVHSLKVMTEIDSLVMTFSPIKNVHKWKHITKEEKTSLIARLLTKFDIKDYDENSNVRKAINKKFVARYRYHRYYMHMYYKDLVESGVDPKSRPYRDMNQEDWKYIIETLYNDPTFQRDPMTEEPPHIVDFFHDSHVNKKGKWVSAEAESRYERMKELSTQNLEEDVEPLTQDEIACTVLGSRPGYKKGFGHDLKPLSSNQSFSSIAEFREQADMIKELQATVDSLQKERDETKVKLEKFEDAQQQMMQQLLQMQLQMERALQGISTNAHMSPES